MALADALDGVAAVIRPSVDAYTVARETYEAHARRHPMKAARLLARMEAKQSEHHHAGLIVPRDHDRLAGMVDGLRTGLDGAVRCRRCGRRLEDPQSVARGVGPECVRKAA